MIHRSNRMVLALLWCFLLMGGVNAAGATTLSDHDFTCGFCGQTFKDKIIWSTNVMDRDAEFRPLAMGLDPLPYYVHLCPHCGYANTSEEVKLTDREKAEIGKFLTAYRQNHGAEPTPADKYEVLANIFIIRKLPSDKIAYAYQRAAWMADDANDQAAGRKFRTAALEYLTKALKDHETDPKVTPVLTYVAGELNRRLGRFDEALQWFSRVDPNNQDLKDLVAQQSKLARKKDARPDLKFPMR
ncbi:MAG: DUF2225 domain-containing protein [Deltaproteobacteria bacterium]|nr:DUF2225 domain-containing protein [Deltaproteobacteria bacterium]